MKQLYSESGGGKLSKMYNWDTWNPMGQNFAKKQLENGSKIKEETLEKFICKNLTYSHLLPSLVFQCGGSESEDEEEQPLDEILPQQMSLDYFTKDLLGFGSPVEITSQY